ncbi:ArsC/Spx/MgsR family protein [Cumulibacter soli]|uniref:ArsC/Spx/MgsR family protein n=1 Tax=Cumulibacter soli TaxID=2546344 RepID=UPI0010683B5D|nr:ArsC/Spx/MgsR family protein [Cumulibacter soli]
MAELTILHNPRCSKSRAALDAAGDDARVVQYLKEPLDEAQLLDLLSKLTDEPAALVRRDRFFTELGLREEDIRSAEQVATLLAEHPRLMERPVLIRGDAAIIGRPTDRIAAFLEQ